MTGYRPLGYALALVLALGGGVAAMTQETQLAQATSPGKDTPATGHSGHGAGAGTMSGQGMGMGQGQGMMGGGMGPGMMESRVEGRIAFLHTELKVTPAQAKLWDSYADALRASDKEMTGMQATMMKMKSATALPERLGAAETMMSERLDALKKVKAAVLPLYATFSAEQKATADELMPMMGMGMGMGM